MILVLWYLWFQLHILEEELVLQNQSKYQFSIIHSSEIRALCLMKSSILKYLTRQFHQEKPLISEECTIWRIHRTGNPLIFIILISIYRYISIGLFIMGCGSLMFALPHFVTDTYLKNDEILSRNNTGAHPDLCSTTSGQSSFSSNSNLDQMGKSKALATALHLSNFKYFFIFGQVLHGIGAAPLITLGTTLLDESVGRISSPLYIGIFQVSAVFFNDMY